MNRVKNKVFLTVLILMLVSPGIPCQTSFSQGEELFMQNRPQEALSFLEAAVEEDPAHVQAFLYLGIVYKQINRLDDAISTYNRILPRGGREADRIAYNLGNAYFMKGEHDTARQYYSQAIELNPNYASAYLNRANAQVRTRALNEAIVDYEEYLLLDPGSSQREEILNLIAFIREEFVAIERQRIMAEEAARAAEEAARAEAERQRLIAEEAARAAEEAARAEAERQRLIAEEAAERRRQLLEEVSELLQAAALDSRGLSVGTDEIHDFESEFELE